MTNASEQSKRYPRGPAHLVVIVPKGTVQGKNRVHAGSKSARIRDARRMRPDLAGFGVLEMVFGSRESTDTVVVFDPALTPGQGLQ